MLPNIPFFVSPCSHVQFFLNFVVTKSRDNVTRSDWITMACNQTIRYFSQAPWHHHVTHQRRPPGRGRQDEESPGSERRRHDANPAIGPGATPLSARCTGSAGRPRQRAASPSRSLLWPARSKTKEVISEFRHTQCPPRLNRMSVPKSCTIQAKLETCALFLNNIKNCIILQTA